MQTQQQKQGDSTPEDDAFASLRRAEVRADISRRLKKICGHLSEKEFDSLVDLMADNKIKGDRRTTL